MNLNKSSSLIFAIWILAVSVQAQELLNKPAWLPQLSLGLKESYDNNIFGVSGNGMSAQSAWITTLSPGIGFDFASLSGPKAHFQSLLLSYTPDFVFFSLPHNQPPYNEPSQNYNAHKFNALIQGTTGDFSYTVSNAFLYNDGSKVAPTYALNQLNAAGEADKYRDHYAYVPSRERANQIQDREGATLQYDLPAVFFRASDSLLDYNMNTIWHNSSHAPYEGYQNFVDRSDVNGGLDLGWKAMTNLAFLVGYRYGSQYQQQYTPAITSDFNHYSSGTYQRALFGVEGKPWNWLRIKLSGGPDFRDYNSHAPLNNLHPTKYYGEASLVATLSAHQSLTFNYKQWQWESSTGYIPTWDSAYDLDYRWNATPKLSLDVEAKIQEYDLTGSTDVAAGTDPSLRADRLYTLSPAVTYAFTPQLSATLSYVFDAGNNELYTLPAANQPAYRNFTHQVVSLGLLYKF